MQKYEFSLTCILPHKDRIYDSVIIRENTGQWKPVFSHILCSVNVSIVLLLFKLDTKQYVIAKWNVSGKHVVKLK